MAIKKRAFNRGKQQAGPDTESPFVNIPWGRTQDEEFDAWIDGAGTSDMATLVEGLLSDGLTVKLGSQGDSRFATIDSREASDAGTKHLLSGWSDTSLEALQIACFKWESLLGKNWDHPTADVAKSRRR